MLRGAPPQVGGAPWLCVRGQPECRRVAGVPEISRDTKGIRVISAYQRFYDISKARRQSCSVWDVLEHNARSVGPAGCTGAEVFADSGEAAVTAATDSRATTI